MAAMRLPHLLARGPAPRASAGLAGLWRCPAARRLFCAGQGRAEPPPVVQIEYKSLLLMTPEARQKLQEAFVGPAAYGAIAVINVPGYGEKLQRAFRAGINLALADPEGRTRARAVSNTYPGWSGSPGEETHPLQSSFLFNVKEEVPGGKPDPYFGKNIFPSKEYRHTWVELATPMHEVALKVLQGCDVVVEDLTGRDKVEWRASGRSLHRLGLEGPVLAGRFICYDSGFTRMDDMLSQAGADDPDHLNGTEPVASIPDDKQVGHAGDGLASMRTHSTPIKSVGHASDGLASVRTHSTPVKSAGHAGDGLASMRTHSTPVKTAGHAGDGLASMRTHATPVKTAGHAGDGLASMRTHSTPVKTAGHAGDGLASMRTHSTPVKTAGHAGDGLASMRTHSTPVKTAGTVGEGTMHVRNHGIQNKMPSHATDAVKWAPSHAMALKMSGHGGETQVSARAHSTQTMPVKGDDMIFEPALMYSEEAELASSEPKSERSDVAEHGDYWLPWHIDSNFVTVLHKEMYARESDTSLVPEPEGAGLLLMNQRGDVAKMDTHEDAVIVQLGAFAQIYTGGHLAACRHAVCSPRPPGIARFNYCNFWYVPWNTVCNTPPGREALAVNSGWNAMMDESYIDITMKQSFAAFRQFMTSPEARVQFADTVGFKELSELLPLPARVPARFAPGQGQPPASIVVDIMTDVRCPFSLISQVNLEHALVKLGLNEHVLIRFHPVFLNPNVPKEGECLDDYLLREYGYSKEYAHSDRYPLRLMGLEAGVTLNPRRRVVNTFEAFSLIELAQEVGKQRELVKALSHRYFELAEDISDEEVLRAAAAEVGLDAKLVEERIGAAREAVASRYAELAPRVGEVPHFLLREHVSGNGVEVGGNRSVTDWEAALQAVLEKSRFVGMAVPGLHGQDVWLAEANPSAPVSMAVQAQHGWAPQAWPYKPEHFSRMDESPDQSMYSAPRFVNHLDEASLARLTGVYDSFFQAAPPDFAVLDLCSSWVSHFPQERLGRARVVVHGLNRQELEANRQATELHVQDLNDSAELPWTAGTFDFVTLALSVQYLTDPRAAFAEMHRILKPGGVALVAFSHRCFIEKAVRVWAEETYDGEGHAHLVSRYFQQGPAGGWEHLSSVDVSPAHGDPMWLVTAVKGVAGV